MPPPTAELSSARKWAITVSVMLVTVMQIVDTSVTNVALPHMQGSLSASVDEIAWVLTSYLAANAVAVLVVLPLMRRVRSEPGPSGERVEGLPSAVE
jgi:MFS family permease